MSVISRQEILPTGIAVGIGMSVRSQDITGTVIGIRIGLVTHSTEQLTQSIIGVGYSSLPRSRVGGDIAQRIVGVAIRQCRRQPGVLYLRTPVGSGCTNFISWSGGARG